MYLIKKIGFDGYENEINSAIFSSIVGVLPTEEAAIEYIIESSKKIKNIKDGMEMNIHIMKSSTLKI